jgi:suppressor of ftsI
MKKAYWIIGAVAAVVTLGAWWLSGSGGWRTDGSHSGHGMMSRAGTGRQGELFQDAAALPDAEPSEEVILKDGDVFDLAITPVKKAIGGRTVSMLGYNGSVPGPVFRIPEGAEVTINLKNKGTMPTTLHSHGVRVENAFDGVPGVTQEEIAPGESFAYKLKFSDPGAFWYHPHVRTDYAVEAGLYGSFIVVPKDAAYWAPANREVPLMLDDIALDNKGIETFDAETADHTLMGRFGSTMLVNGETNYGLQAKQGEVVRLYLTNAANTRLFNFAVPGAKMKLVGADLGRYAKESLVDGVLVAPGERRVVDVLFDKAGSYEMKHKTPDKEYVLGKVSVSSESVATSYGKEFSSLRTNAAVAEEMGGLMDAYLAKAPDKSVRLTLDMNGQMGNMMDHGGHGMGGAHMMPDGAMMGGEDMGMPARNAAPSAAGGSGDGSPRLRSGEAGDAYEWEDAMAPMNRASTSKTLIWKLVDEATGKSNMDIDSWNFKTGDKVKIRIFNDPKSMHPMQHPIHFHGQRFMVLSTNGARNENPVWQDTALLAKGDTADILLEASNPGSWMAHCHILEHAESGMMLPFNVE